MIEVGRICVKIAGRDAGKRCVVIDVLDSKFVLIDGQTRRRKCNMLHLEPLAQTVKISKGASRDKIVSAFKDLGIELREKKSKKPAAKPKKVRKVKPKATKPVKQKVVAKPVEKKTEEVPVSKPAEPKTIPKKKAVKKVVKKE
ncbi:50S ribosomal protein L14e [Candidatus Woesearchaeota archaeon CG10_big_fil_rev_8_21_14_0_10_37_12]|nr:MAG: 50S ribosomal protein L14e [Candidatus Woesearchaeota archaeon CG10_big_fil_rev_8_21_14_0_10_37_12]